MSQPAFDIALRFILDAEGGYVNDPRDPGGPTKHGVSWRAVRLRDVDDSFRAVSARRLALAKAVRVLNAAGRPARIRTVEDVEAALEAAGMLGQRYPESGQVHPAV